MQQSQRTRANQLGIPVLALAALSKKTVWVRARDVNISYRDPEKFSISPSAILHAWSNVVGKDDQMVNPLTFGATIAAGAFNITTFPPTPRQDLIGVKASISGNTNINTGAVVNATLQGIDNSNNLTQVLAQLKLKAFSVDYYHFFAKSISQIVNPFVQRQGNWVTDTVGPTFFQQLVTYFGTGPDGLTVQFEPLNSRHPDVMEMVQSLDKARKFIAFAEKNVRSLCDQEAYDWDNMEFDSAELSRYELV